jgi:hypothetical protein
MSANRKVKMSKHVTSEDVDLVKAWLDGEIGAEQVAVAKEFKHSQQSYSYIAQVARFIWQNQK